MKKRTNWDFSEHVHRVEIFKSDDSEIRIDHFQVGKNRMNYIQFINTPEVLTVTGDFGNWVFCRPFIPNEENFVSDYYWCEKLSISSHQEYSKYSPEDTAEEIQTYIDTGLEEYGYEGKELEEAKEWFKELLEETDDEYSYISKAYRDPYKPYFIDHEQVPFQKEMFIQLKIIFDAFDEICNRLKVNSIPT